MNKVKCLGCNVELVSKYRHDYKQCVCENHTFTDGGNDYMRLGGKDFKKILIWNDNKNEYVKFSDKLSNGGFMNKLKESWNKSMDYLFPMPKENKTILGTGTYPINRLISKKEEKGQDIDKYFEIPFDEQIENIMDSIDFNKIHKTMKALNWRWYYPKSNKTKVPSIKRIKETANRLLSDIVKTHEKYEVGSKDYYMATGGFEATIDKGIVCLSFVVEKYYGNDLY